MKHYTQLSHRQAITISPVVNVEERTFVSDKLVDNTSKQYQSKLNINKKFTESEVICEEGVGRGKEGREGEIVWEGGGGRVK